MSSRLELWLAFAFGSAASPIVGRLRFGVDGGVPLAIYPGDVDIVGRPTYPLTALTLPA